MKHWKAILFFLIIFSRQQIATAQKNIGFESGFKSWQVSGNKSNVTIDSTNAYEGKCCARISSNASIFQRINISPLSVLSFNIYMKCSDTVAKAYSFIRFYDM